MRKSILLITIILLLTLGSKAQFAGGNGSAKNPFQVATAAQLDEVRNYMGSTYYFILINDINLTTYLASGGAGWTKWGALGWQPIGNDTDPFQASLNGKGFEITGLKFDRSGENYLGLFGSIGANGDVSDLGVGSNKSFLLKGENYIGVLCGSLNSGSISDCYVVGDIAGHNYLGGLTGNNSSGTIQNCKANSAVTGNYIIGAFTGSNASGGTINNSFAEGSVTAINDAAGFVGYNYESTISNCYCFANVSQPSNSQIIFGGFVGFNNQGAITNCYSAGWVKFNGTVIAIMGFCGFVATGTGYEMSGNFWDTETSGATSTAGIATGKTTAMMKTCGTFTAAGWDFMDETTNGSEDSWGINADENDGYPFLAWQGYENNTPFTFGDGSEADPFQISTPEELNNLRNFIGSEHSDKYFRLMNDIDLADYLATGEGFDNWGTEGWLQIGNSFDVRFYGKLDGDGHKITGLWINRPDEDYIAFFGNLGYYGEIKNLGIETDESLSVIGSQIVAVLAAVNNGTIENCYVNGNVETSFTSGTSVGVITGTNSGTIRYCYAIGTNRGRGRMGGLVGRNGIYAHIENCYAHVNITYLSEGSDSTTGAFVGKNYCGKILNCYSTGWVKYGEELQPDNGFCGNVDTGNGYEMAGNYWDIETSGATSTGGEVDEFASGKTKFQMKQQSTFTGWDFSGIWSIISSGNTVSYPFLTNNAQIPAPGLETLFAGGDGSEADPYQISTPAHLNNVRNYLGSNHIDKHFQLINDIDLSVYLAEGGDGYAAWGTEGWLPIGEVYFTSDFRGKFNGNGYKISGLWINRPTESVVALFMYLGVDGEISNLGVETDENSAVTGNSELSVLVAVNNGIIEDCYAIGKVISTSANFSYAGIIVGNNMNAVRYCYAMGAITGNRYLGGFVGLNNNGATTSNCYAHVNVTYLGSTSWSEVGAFAGKNSGGEVINNYSTGWVKYGEVIKTDKGFCGSITSDSGFEMTGNYWDIQTSGATSTGGAINEYASGKTTIEMKQQSTFVGWDFGSIWSIVSETEVVSYPFLSDNVQTPEPGLESLFTEGAGSETNPFHITTPTHLNNIRYFLGESHAKKYFQLMNDIDLTDYLATGDGHTAWGAAGWLPIGKTNFSSDFEGKLNGNGYKITGLWINRPSEDVVALFVYLGVKGEITNLGVETDENSAVIGNSELSLLVAINTGTIENCYAIGEVISTSMFFSSAGIIVGNNIGAIRNCFAMGAISGNRELGGLVGANNNCAITSNCFAHVNVTYLGNTSWPEVGAFAGTNSGGKLINNYSTGWVKYGEVINTDKGFCGNISSDPCFEMSGNLWDMESSGSTTSAGNATGKTTAEMKTYATFIDAGWDFMDENINGTSDIWGINHENNSGYPFLSWQGYSNIPEHVNIEIEKTHTSVQIDGVEESIWDLVEPVPISKNYIGETPTVDAYWKALWCDSGIYVLLNVQDDNHWPAWEAGEDQIWDYDWTNVFFDVNDTLIDGRGTKDFGKGHYQTYIPFTEEGYDTPVLNSLPDALTPGGSYAYSLTSENYVIEHFFPFDNFVNINGDTLNKNSFLALGEIGFDVTITDQDEGITLLRQRKVWQSDGSIDEAWNNMDGCGTITLIERTQDNLQLANLNLIYGQIECFNAFDTIIVAGNGNPVDFLSGSSAELIAGQSIRFLPGFHAFEGSFMNASITTDGTFCDGASGSIVQNPQPEKSGNANKVTIPEEGVSKAVKLYPNPNKGDFSVQVSNMGEGAEISVYNALGINVYKTLLRENLQRINLENVRPGFYIVKVSDGKDQFVKKVIIE